ncbi:transketolase [Peptoniphilus obesi]|uniref:transketolase n=1 Tax=Peptoniphilus obesi TaxID=1472765 RepID=UPI0004BA0A7F|nr:transketolase [Peptoniphilus obesi]
MNIEQKSIDTIRMLSVDQVQAANSGHPGLPLGAAPMAYALWKQMKKNPEEANWFNRDRFILSAGHGSALLYSLLHLYGYGLTIEDLKNFRQVGSLTPGHPEYGHTLGVDATTGPLGQGISMAVGMAMAESHLADKYNKDDLKIIDHYTYVICGDGDLMEGISNEASSLAGTLKLGKLIVLYDSNNITIEGSTDLAFTESVRGRYDALNWHTEYVEDGNDISEIQAAIERAKEEKDRPSLIEIKTEIGFGSPRVGKSKAHGEPLGDDMQATREYYSWGKEFEVADDVYEHFKQINIDNKFEYEKDKRIEEVYKNKYKEDYKKLTDSFKQEYDLSILDQGDFYEFEKDMASRAASGEALNRTAEKFDLFFGGSADLAPSNKSAIKNSDNFSASNRSGKNINFGVREHAMGAIANGINLHGGLKSYGATFLVFSDYLKAAVRLSALQELPTIYILTHDSIGVGEDGPTHQPIEQLAMLRSIPNNIVLRPADPRETAVAWSVAMKSKKTPVCLILSRQNLPRLENSSRQAEKGAYIIKKEKEKLNKIIIATGSEVKLALDAAEGKDDVRVVSMPSMEIFEQEADSYKEEILPLECQKRLVVEAASPFGWGRYAGLKGKIIGMNSFGASGKGSEVYKHFGITVEKVKEELENL